jgi:hypothetical protein
MSYDDGFEVGAFNVRFPVGPAATTKIIQQFPGVKEVLKRNVQPEPSSSACA